VCVAGAAEGEKKKLILVAFDPDKTAKITSIFLQRFLPPIL